MKRLTIIDGKTTLDKLDNLPQKSGIYFVHDSDENILYIGRANNIRFRWSNHHRYNQAKEVPGEVYIAWRLVDKQDLNLIEKRYIKEFSPEWNNQLTGIRSKFKRQAIDESLYYEAVKAAAEIRMDVKPWIEGAIKERLKREQKGGES